MSSRKLALALTLALCATLFAANAFAGKAKPTYYCDKSTTPPCTGSNATVNAKKSKITELFVAGPRCVRANGYVEDDFVPKLRAYDLKFTGKNKNRFSAKGNITLLDSQRDGPYSFPFKLSGSIRHGRSISAKVTVTGAVEPCANIQTISVTLKKR